MRPERPARGSAVWIIPLVLVCVAGLVVWGERREPRLAGDAVRNVAGDAAVLWVAEVRSPGRRSSLWCGAVDRPDGLVAVLIRTPFPLPSTVREVAPAWVEGPNPLEMRILDKCRERVG